MAQGMNAPLYTVDILRLAASLPAPAELDRVDGSGDARSPACGSVVAAEVQVRDGHLEALSLDVQACAFGQASAALVTQQAAGRTREEIEAALAQLSDWLSGERETPPDWPGFEALSPARPRKARHPAIQLPFRALLAAMESTAK